MSKFCMNCGTELPEKALFCRKCGTKLDTYDISAENEVAKVADSKPVDTNLDTKNKKIKVDLSKIDPTIIIAAAMIMVTVIIVVIILAVSGNKAQKGNSSDSKTLEEVDDIGISEEGTGEIEEPDDQNDALNAGNDIEGNDATVPDSTSSVELDESGNGTAENPDSMSSQEFVNAWKNDPYLSIFDVPKFGESITVFKYDGYSSAFFYGWTTDEASTFGYDTVNAAGFRKNVQTQIDADNFYYMGSNDQGYGVMVVKEEDGYVMVAVGDYGIMMGSSSTTVNGQTDSKLGNFQKDAFEKIGTLEE